MLVYQRVIMDNPSIDELIFFQAGYCTTKQNYLDLK